MQHNNVMEILAEQNIGHSLRISQQIYDLQKQADLIIAYLNSESHSNFITQELLKHNSDLAAIQAKVIYTNTFYPKHIHNIIDRYNYTALLKLNATLISSLQLIDIILSQDLPPTP